MDPGWLGTIGGSSGRLTQALADLAAVTPVVPLALLIGWLDWAGRPAEGRGPPSPWFLPLGLTSLALALAYAAFPLLHGWKPWGSELVVFVGGPLLFAYGAIWWALEQLGPRGAVCPGCGRGYLVSHRATVRPDLDELHVMCRACGYEARSRESTIATAGS